MESAIASYDEFLASKLVSVREVGFAVRYFPDQSKDYQRAMIEWACRVGRCAFFADCGLGKTLMQLAWAHNVVLHTGGRVLILAPLAVAKQTEEEAVKFGIPGVASMRDDDGTTPIVVTNYEMLDRFDVSAFVGVVLDESSILKNFMGKTRIRLTNAFAATPYRLCCTATPSPNDFMELGQHCQFLGVMDSNEMLARWFINDTMNFGTYRIKGHAAKDFWEWVASWACYCDKPSSLGFSDDGFDLPGLDIETIPVPVDITEGAPEGQFLRDGATASATTLFAEKRISLDARVARVADAVNSSAESFIVWCHTNAESEQITKAIPGAIEVKGADSIEAKEKALAAFSSGEARVIVTKPSIAGHGLNWQHCHRMIFAGLSYSFEDFYQAVRRSHRFGQTERVLCQIVVADTETGVLARVMEKVRAHEEMQIGMTAANARMSLAHRRTLSTHCDTRIESGDKWTLRLGDCVQRIREIETGSIDFSVFSPPFANLYIYSDSIRDMGNCDSSGEFFEHFRFLIAELFRIMRPGRIVAVHCKDLVLYKGRDGEAGIQDFPGDIIRAFTAAGFAYHSRVTIWKCPVTEMQRTKSHGLLHKSACNDSSNIRMGLPDYLLAFRRWPKNEDEQAAVVPVIGEGNGGSFRFSDYVGMDAPRADPNAKDRERDLSISIWQRYASPVWDDVNQMNVLNTDAARDDKDEKHICPLQLDVIQRAIHLWSNPGDLVFTPFAGIGSELVGAHRLGRRSTGIELKEAYFERGVAMLRAMESELSLFGAEE